MFSKIKKAVSSVIIMMLALGAAQALAAEINISGSTTVLPVMQKAGEAFMNENPGVKLMIAGGGSGSGLKALGEKLCDVAMASRDIKESEVKDAQANGVNPTRLTIALDALAPIIHPSNKVQSLSMDQLRDIYTGKIANWKEVGGADARIVLVSRDSASGTFETWEELVMKKQKISARSLASLQRRRGAGGGRQQAGHRLHRLRLPLEEREEPADQQPGPQRPERPERHLADLARPLHLHQRPAQGRHQDPVRLPG